MISKVQRAGKKLHLLKGEHAEFEEAVIDFKVDFQELDAKKILKRSPSLEASKPIYKDSDLKQPLRHLSLDNEEVKSPEFPENATEEDKQEILKQWRKQKNHERNEEWLTSIREYASTLNLNKLTKK